MAGKSKAQRALRNIDNNETLLSRTSSQLEETGGRILGEKNILEPDFPLFDSGTPRSYPRKQPKHLHSNHPYSDEEEEDSLANIDFWTIPKALSPKIPKALKVVNQTPRGDRANRRQIWRKPRGEDEIDKVGQLSSSYFSANVDSIPNYQESRPSSSYSDDPRAILNFEPLPKISPIKVKEDSDLHLSLQQLQISTQSSTPEAQIQATLPSPKKITTIPKMPVGESSAQFWSQETVDHWNDQHSPRKDRIRSRAFEAGVPDEGEVSNTLTSPNKSPLKNSREGREAKKSFEEIKRELADNFLQELDNKITNGQICEIAKETGGVRIIWSNKLNSTAGRANWKKETHTTKHSDGSITSTEKHHASIELAEKVIDCPERLYNTLAHEFCHLANFMVSGIKNNPHGKEFKAWGKKCTTSFAHLGVEVTTKHSYDIDYKYIWQCSSDICQINYKRHSKSIDIAKHRCGKCRSKLLQIKPAVRATKTSDYQVFVKQNFKTLKKKHPKETHGFIMKKISELYRMEKSQASESTDCQSSIKELAEGLELINLGSQ